jgi:hypothetical protein
MTTTEFPNFVKVEPKPRPATGNGNPAEEGQEALHAQPRAYARVGATLTAGAAAVRKTRANRRVEAPTADVGDRPDLWRRQPLSLAEVWERHRDDIATAWGDHHRIRAVWLVVFSMLVSVPVTALAYGLALCAQADHRSLWLAVGLAIAIVCLTI